MDTKNFNSWNEYKKELHIRKIEQLFYREGEVWFCSVGVNIGWEVDGKNATFDRPVLIMKKFWPSLFLYIPFSSQLRRGKSCYQILYHGQRLVLLFFQARVCDARRLRRRIYTIEKREFEMIRVAFKDWF